MEKLLHLTTIASVLTAILYSSLVVLLDRSSGTYALLDEWLPHLTTALPAVLAAVRAISDRRQRVAWWLVSAGIVSIRCSTSSSS